MSSKLNPENLPFGELERRALATKLKADVEAARARGELISAMLYASDALMLYPNEPEYLAVVDGLCGGVEDPLALVPAATGSVHVATASVRAHILHKQGKNDPALDLLGACVAVAPDLAYLEWARQWLTPALIQSVGYEKLSNFIAGRALRLSLDVPTDPDAGDRRLPNVRAAADIFAAMRAQFSGEVFLHSGEAMIRRRLGDPQATLQVALGGAQRFAGDWRMQAVTASAWRDAKNADSSLKHARLAMGIEPKDARPLHDAAWTFFDANRGAEAIKLLDEALEINADYQAAKVAQIYMRFRVQGQDEDRQALIRMRERRWWDRQARALADEIDPPTSYDNMLPGPGEATAAGAIALTNELRHVLKCCGQGANIGFDLLSTYMESPSVALGFDVAIRALGGASANLRVIPERVQTPDPRKPKAAVPHEIWAFDDMAARRVLPAADPRAQSAIAAVADRVFRLADWDAAAQKVAADAGPA